MLISIIILFLLAILIRFFYFCILILMPLVLISLFSINFFYWHHPMKLQDSDIFTLIFLVILWKFTFFVYLGHNIFSILKPKRIKP